VDTSDTPKLGLVALATPRHGGTYQYTRAMIDALKLVHGYKITIYTDSQFYADAPFPTRPLVNSRITQALNLISAELGWRRSDPFIEEDILLAPIYSTALLHTTRPFAFTLHDLQEHHYPNHFSVFQRFWRHAVNRQITKKAAIILCESKYVKEDIVRIFNVDKQKVEIIVSPPPRLLNSDRTSTSIVIRDVKTKYNLPSRFLFYPAQFWPHKNHSRLIEAFGRARKMQPDLALVLTGRPQGTFRKVMKQARTAGLERDIRHLGFVQQDELEALYELATMLVMPSLFESVSIPIYEAFMAGTPVAAAAVLAIPEQVGDAGVLFDPHSPDSIASAILLLANDPVRASGYARKGRERMSIATSKRYASNLQSLLERLRLDVSQPSDNNSSLPLAIKVTPASTSR